MYYHQLIEWFRWLFGKWSTFCSKISFHFTNNIILESFQSAWMKIWNAPFAFRLVCKLLSRNAVGEDCTAQDALSAFIHVQSVEQPLLLLVQTTLLEGWSSAVKICVQNVVQQYQNWKWQITVGTSAPKEKLLAWLEVVYLRD